MAELRLRLATAQGVRRRRNPRWKHDRKRNRGDGRDTINVVNINRDTVRVWQPSARIQRQQLQRQRNAPDFNGNARARRGDANLRRSDPGVSNLARNLPGEIRRPSLRAPNVDPQNQTERSSRGTALANGRGREEEEKTAAINQTQRSNGSLSR